MKLIRFREKKPEPTTLGLTVDSYFTNSFGTLGVLVDENIYNASAVLPAIRSHVAGSDANLSLWLFFRHCVRDRTIEQRLRSLEYVKTTSFHHSIADVEIVAPVIPASFRDFYALDSTQKAKGAQKTWNISTRMRSRRSSKQNRDYGSERRHPGVPALRKASV